MCAPSSSAFLYHQATKVFFCVALLLSLGSGSPCTWSSVVRKGVAMPAQLLPCWSRNVHAAGGQCRFLYANDYPDSSVGILPQVIAATFGVPGMLAVHSIRCTPFSPYFTPCAPTFSPPLMIVRMGNHIATCTFMTHWPLMPSSCMHAQSDPWVEYNVEASIDVSLKDARPSTGQIRPVC